METDVTFGFHLAKQYPRIFGANAEGARSILSGVASSMISIAGVTFSITIVALSLASVQYTSRILRNLMRDRANQTVLGVFLSIFVYCLIVLRTIRGGTDSFVPSLSIVTGILLGITGIGFLIFFIHHVATSIQASSSISSIGKETLAVIKVLYPEPHAQEEKNPHEGEQLERENSWTMIPAQSVGYIQNVDTDGLITWTEHNKTIVRMTRGIGEFMIAGKPIVAIAKDEKPTPPDDQRAQRFFQHFFLSHH